MNASKKKISLSLFLSALTAASAWVPTAAAFSSFGPWPGSSPRVTYFVNPNNQDVSTADALAAVRTAADAWKIQGHSNFEFVFGGTTNSDSIALDGKNNVFFRNSVSGSGPGVIATTYSWSDNQGNNLEFDMVFWDGAFNFFTGNSCQGRGMYIEDVGTHEFGHALGLNHSTVLSATMYPSISSCSSASRSLDADDIAGVQSLYGVASSTPAPTPTQPAPVPTNPAPVPTNPAPVPTKPAPGGVNPVPVPTQPAPIPTSPAPGGVNPVPVPTQPAPIPTSPAPLPTKGPTSGEPSDGPGNPSNPGFPGVPGPVPGGSCPNSPTPNFPNLPIPSAPNAPGATPPGVTSPKGLTPNGVSQASCSTDFSALIASANADAAAAYSAAEKIFRSKLLACGVPAGQEATAAQDACQQTEQTAYQAIVSQLSKDQEALLQSIFARMQTCLGDREN